MYNTIIELHICGFDTGKSERCFVSTSAEKYQPISFELSDSTISLDEYLCNMFEKYVDLGFGWVNTKLLDVSQNDNDIIISYCCGIPANTKLKDAYYTSYSSAIIHKIARKSLLYV